MNRGRETERGRDTDKKNRTHRHNSLPAHRTMPRSTFFHQNGRLWEQTDRVAMGSPLSPIVANLFMELFEEEALSLATDKPKFWVHYVDD